MWIDTENLWGFLQGEIEKLSKADRTGKIRPAIVAIDGRCASGKTTLAMRLKEGLDCNVVSMDDFFLQPHQRTKERLGTPGGNVDYERVLAEVLDPLSKGEQAVYRPYRCHSRKFDGKVVLAPDRLTIVEGSYACHPALWDYYDLRIFLTVEPTEQLRRIARRNGPEGVPVFEQKWIPLEETYFSELSIPEKCDFCAVTG